MGPGEPAHPRRSAASSRDRPRRMAGAGHHGTGVPRMAALRRLAHRPQCHQPSRGGPRPARRLRRPRRPTRLLQRRRAGRPQRGHTVVGIRPAPADHGPNPYAALGKRRCQTLPRHRHDTEREHHTGHPPGGDVTAADLVFAFPRLRRRHHRGLARAPANPHPRPGTPQPRRYRCAARIPGHLDRRAW